MRAGIVLLVTLGLVVLRPVGTHSQPAAEGQAGRVRSDSPEPTLEDLLATEVQSVFGASRFLQRTTEAPAAVTVVTAQEIARYGWRTLADVLRATRGFYVTDDRSWAYVGTRGFQRPGDYNTRLLLLLDGRRTNDNVYDQALVQEDFLVDLADVERIEIIRGPSSSLYGSNAFFGVINVVTRPTDVADRPTLGLELGTLGLKTGRVRFGRQVTDALTVNLSASAQEMDGVRRLYFPEFDSPETGFGVANGLDYASRRNVLGTARVKGFTARAGFNQRTRGVPTGAYGIEFNAPGSWVQDERQFADGEWQGRVGGGWMGQLRGGFDRYEYLGRFPYRLEGPGEVMANYDVGRGLWLTGEGLVSRELRSGHRVTFGLERRQHLENRQLNYFEGAAPDFDLDWPSSTTAVYAQDQWRLSRQVLLSVGGRYDQYSRFANPVTPRLGLIVEPSPTTSLKWLYGEAFRAPNGYETNFADGSSAKGNPRLQPERIRTAEFVVEHYAGRRLRLSGSVFRYDVNRLIDFTTDDVDGFLQYVNVGEARAHGVEGAAEARWPNGAQARVSYTFSTASNRRTETRLTNSPAHVGQALFSVPTVARTFVGVEARALSSRATAAGGAVGGHVVPNLTVSRDMGARGMTVSFTIANLTNVRYADPVSTDFRQDAIAQNGRTARLRASWAF